MFSGSSCTQVHGRAFGVGRQGLGQGRGVRADRAVRCAGWPRRRASAFRVRRPARSRACRCTCSTRLTLSGRTAASGRMRWKPLADRSSRDETAAGRRSRLLGVMMIRGLRQGRSIWRRRAWKYWAGRGQVHHLEIVLGGHGQEALQARAGMLGTHALEAVGQQHDEAGQAAPLLLGAGDELIDDGLGHVDEVAELGLPDDQALGRVQAVAVLEAEHAVLGERAVVDLQMAPGPRPDGAGACRWCRPGCRAAPRGAG